MLGVTPWNASCGGGSEERPSSGGRQMPSHWGQPSEHRQQVLLHGHAIRAGRGRCRATLYYEGAEALTQAKNAPQENTSVTSAKKSSMFSGGEGANQRGRVLGILERGVRQETSSAIPGEDNGYAISVRWKFRRPAGASRNSCGTFPGCSGGMRRHDPSKLLRLQGSGAVLPATAGPRADPCARHAPLSHSLSDDEKLYSPPRNGEEEARRDPISKLCAIF